MVQTDALNFARHAIQLKAFLFRHTDSTDTYRIGLLVNDFTEVIVNLAVLIGLAVKERHMQLI